jgi:hypothetical protein
MNAKDVNVVSFFMSNHQSMQIHIRNEIHNGFQNQTFICLKWMYWIDTLQIVNEDIKIEYISYLHYFTCMIHPKIIYMVNVSVCENNSISFISIY